MRSVVQEPPQPTSSSSATVLVIDDSATILDVVERALTRAGIRVEAATTALGGLEVAKSRPPALVLLDHMMPDLSGAQLAEQMQAEPSLAEIPVVVMSAQVHEASEAFARLRSVVDFITKPFSPDALVTVVRHALDKHAPGSVKEPPSPAQEALASTESAGAANPDEEADAGPALSGKLGIVTLPDVLWMLQQQEQTGVLRLSHRGARIELHLRNGLVDLAAAVGVGEEFLLGRYLAAAGALDQASLEHVLEDRQRAASDKCDQPLPLLGEDLVSRGLIQREDLKRALSRQTAELVFEALRWETGRFELLVTGKPASHAREAGLALAMDVLLMEGFRRVDEWRLIEAAIDSFDTVFVRHEPRVAEMANGRLTRDEIAVLELVDGRNTVRDITRQSHMGSFDVSKMIYRLLRAGVIRRRVPAVACI